MFFAGCPEPTFPGNSLPGLTLGEHSALYFPIEEGPHAVECVSCHKDETTFKAFDCLQCHEHEPVATNLLHETVPRYAYESPECYTCHPQGVQIPPFDHASGRDQCATCHQEGAAFAALPIDGFTHPERGTNDCGACHFSTVDWADVAAFPPGPIADPLADVEVSALLPRYAGTSIVSVTPSLQVLPMPMNHATTQVPTDTLSNCGACHNETATYYPGKLHSSLANLFASQPTECAECHRTSVPTGFVGPLATDPPRDPASGEMKHDAVAWLIDTPTTSGLVPIECGTCHQPPSQAVAATWSSASPTMHQALDDFGFPQPDSCIDCHANSRPNTVFTSLNAPIPFGVTFDHTANDAITDCVRCHDASTRVWTEGRFHNVGDATPSTCLPCHDGERPISTANWVDPDFERRPFDFVTNDAGITHGAGQDCVTCHASPGTGDWGINQNWQGGDFPHGIGTIAENTCIACHSTQRPDLVVSNAAALLGFDHANDGAGDCIGCHQASVEAALYATYFNPATNSLPGGDWQGGVTYPGDFPIGSQNQFITVTEIQLVRSGTNNLVTGTTSTTATIYNQMLHTSPVLPASLNPGDPTNPDGNTCWHCHTNNNGNVTSLVNGLYHPSLDNFSDTPGGAITPIPQPTSNCADCHISPNNIVERASSVLQPMDHDVLFTASVSIDGRTVNGVAQMDCSSCHTSPGTAWDDGVFHANIGNAVPQDCTLCHFPTMATPQADVVDGTIYTMRHRSVQLTSQNCQTCHTSALAQATQTPPAFASWDGGALHPTITAQPGSCLECHANSEPAQLTQSAEIYNLPQGASATNEAQWMNHTARYVVSEDCARCHAADARPAPEWSTATPFHAVVSSVTTCVECHGATGANNNMPVGRIDSQTVTSAAANPATGVAAGTRDQILHDDANVRRHDCNFCHTQVGPSAASDEWAQARFHDNFTAANALIIDGVSGRCSNCHLNVKPGPGFPVDHTTFTDAPGTQDCSSCHSFPGTGTPQAPNWRGPEGGFPQFITVGGFLIPNPPSPNNNTIQAGIANLPHPTLAEPCTTCHAQAGGGKNAIGYDHGSTLINTKCSSCHEAGTNLVGTAWNGALTLAGGAGDSRPFTVATMTVTTEKYPGESLAVDTANHFFGIDCYECHGPPSGIATTTTGAGYVQAWSFAHDEARMNNPDTCIACHGENGVFPPGLVDDPLRALTVNALIPTYAGTSITRVTADTQVMPMQMDHLSPEVPAAIKNDCASCHTDNTTYYPGLFHSSLENLLVAQPQNCADCHITAVPIGFVGALATDPPRNPATGEMKHDAVAWVNDAPTSTGLVPLECGTCHTPPTRAAPATTWADPASFHDALTQAAFPQPDQCIDCHANSRPATNFTSANAPLPVGVTFDHREPAALGECVSCHSSETYASWNDGLFHNVGDATPSTCLPCHAGERPTTTANWIDPDFGASPFDFTTNALGVEHGAGQDCVQCHRGPGAGDWGVDQDWQNGFFTHGANTIASSTCITCHTTQRPDLFFANSATVLGFDHATDGTGDCIGCHQQTVTDGSFIHLLNPATNTLPGGDWAGGISYPGDVLVSSQDEFITVTEIALVRSGGLNLVTSTSSSTRTLFNAMLHTSTALPASLNGGPADNPDTTTCFHCHTNNNGEVTSFANGEYHASLDTFRSTPQSNITPLPQPTTCLDCHAQMRPANIVEKSGSFLQPMDHAARFTTTVNIGGRSVNSVAGIDCGVCHRDPGGVWSDGVFHARIGSAVPQDCNTCHYVAMANTAVADITSGTDYRMKHASTQIRTQNCQLCHTNALARARQTPLSSTQWSGALLHDTQLPNPTTCLECHDISDPPQATQSSETYTFAQGGSATNGRQWMRHTTTYVTGRDCVQCHASDAAAGAFRTSTPFHPTTGSVVTCSVCHGTQNGRGTTVGTNNNLPQGLIDSTTVTTASNDPTTGIAAGTKDRITHTDVNVTSHDCNFCHTQVGSSTQTGIANKEWAQAKFHTSFTGANALLMNGTTGRCSNCHINVKPGPNYSFDHSGFTATSGTTDCSSCHSFPGTGTPTSPNWEGAAGGFPQFITVGGFLIPQPPAANNNTTQAGVANLPHPNTTTTPCTACHTDGGGKNAIGYDHASTVANRHCASCHEAGSNLVGTPWNNATAVPGAGDTRPFTITSLRVTFSGNSLTVSGGNHFFPVDCYECHDAPTGVATVTTGTTYRTRWRFPHRESRMTNPATCRLCHGNNIPD